MEKLKQQIEYAKFFNTEQVCIDLKYAEQLLKRETPTLEKVKKEWEESGYTFTNDKGIITISKLDDEKYYDARIFIETKRYHCSCVDIKEHKLLIKMLKALGWEE